MTKRKVKRFVVPIVYTLTFLAVGISILLMGKTINNLFTKEDSNYFVTGALFDNTLNVMDNTSSVISKPYLDETVRIIKSYYNNNSTKEEQQNSLIYYENTYIQNTGIFYTSDQEFNVISVLDGVVKDIKTDDLMGKTIIIEHKDNLLTMYYSLEEVNVSKGEEIKQNDIIGTSGSNKILKDSKYNLLFEVNYNNTFINPEEFYKMNIKDL